MRIAYVITGLERGGAELQLSRIALALHHKHEICVISLTGGGAIADSLRKEEVQVILLQATPFTVIPKLRAALKSFNPDIIHSFMWHANIASRFAGIGLGKKISSVRVREYSFARRFADTITSPLVDWYTTNSKVVAAHSGLPKKRTTVIYNGVPDSVWKGRSRKPEPRTALMVAHLRREKDYDTLLRVAGLLRGWTFSCAGKGPREKEIRLKIRDQHLVNVHLLGMVEDVTDRMCRAEKLVHLSFAEGMSNTIIEAMLLGVPVIATDTPENRELVAGRGTLVPLRDADAVARALQEKPEATQSAQQWAQRTFSMQQMVAAHEALYARVSQR